jgi:hypothetical protein
MVALFLLTLLLLLMRAEAEVFIYPGIDHTLLQEAMKEGENGEY